MSGNKMIPVEESFAEWRKDPDYVKAYNALENEFSLARHRNTAGAVIAQLERGRPGQAAAAIGMKLRISFEPGTAR
jgi:hypothetical protein